MINLSIQNIIPFLVPHLFPLKIEGYQRKGGDWNLEGPCRSSQVQKPFCVPCFLFVEKGFTLLDLS